MCLRARRRPVPCRLGPGINAGSTIQGQVTQCFAVCIEGISESSMPGRSMLETSWLSSFDATVCCGCDEKHTVPSASRCTSRHLATT